MIKWKPVVDFEGFYEVSSCGQVRSVDRQVAQSHCNKTRLWRGKVLKQTIASTRGYCMVSLSMRGKTYKKYVHRLVAETWLESRNETVNHKDGNKLNNTVDNLEWVSYSYNNHHAFATGLKFPSGGRT